MGPRPAGVAAAGGRSTRRSASRGAARWPPTSATASTATDGELRRSRRYAVARRLAGLFAGVRRPAARSWSPTGGAAGTPTAPAAPVAARPGLAAGAVAPAASTGSAPPPPDQRHARRRWPGCAPDGDGLDLPARLSLFGHTRLPVTEVRAARRARRASRRAPVAAAAVARCGTRWPTLRGRGRCRVRTTRQREPVAAPAARPRSAATPASCSAPLVAGRPRAAPTASDADRRPPTTLLGWLQRDLRANAEPDAATGRPAARRRRPVGAGARLPRRGPPGRRAARGAGRPARRTTRRWSRATSW